MHTVQILQIALCGLASASRLGVRGEADPLSNFRLDSVAGLGSLYYWIGSYYNGTTRIEFTPYAGETATEIECSSFRNQIFTFEFDSILAITERSQYNIGDNPVNAFLIVWPQHGRLYLDSEITDVADHQWSLFSSRPDYTATAVSYVKPNYNLTLEKTQKAPYNLSSTLESYGGENALEWNMTNCNASDVLRWTGNFITQRRWSSLDYNISYADPVLGMQFDSDMANLTIDGFFELGPVEKGKDNKHKMTVPSKIAMSFSGHVDRYHSDDLTNNSATPIWLKTVGFQNNSMNIGYNHTKSSASRVHNSSAMVFAASICLLSIAGLYIIV